MKLTLKQLNDHYDQSKENYDIAEHGGESHIAYYREKFPENYKRLLESSRPKRSYEEIVDELSFARKFYWGFIAVLIALLAMSTYVSMKTVKELDKCKSAYSSKK